MRILHLEDEPLDTEVVRQLLQRSDLKAQLIRVDTMKDFQEALAQGGYTLIFSDYTLPGLNPLEALRLARQLRPETPFIFVSGTLGEESAIEALKQGATDYVLKQRLERLVPAMRRALHEVEEQSRREQAEQALGESEERLARTQKQAEERLRQSEDRYHRFFEEDLTGNFITTPEGQILVCNPAFVRIFGYSSVNEAIGSNFLDMYLDRAERAPLLARLKQQGKIERLEVWRRRLDGQPVYIVENLVGNFDARGELTEIKGYLIDDTERKRAEEALRQANENLAEADRRKDEFLAMLAHELRNPLAPIRSAVQIMGLAGPKEPILQRQRDIIDRQVTHMARLLDDLLDVSRITRGKITLKKQAVRLAEMLTRAVETAAPLIEAHRHTLSIEMDSQDEIIIGDFDRLIQIVGNLLTNAAKYTENGGRIWLESTREGETLVIRVRDTGMGIAPELLPKVFDVFTQAERSLDRAQGGLGLGLSLVRNLTQMHGGRVEACSAGPGKGSEFIVRLPALPASDALPEHPHETAA